MTTLILVPATVFAILFTLGVLLDLKGYWKLLKGINSMHTFAGGLFAWTAPFGAIVVWVALYEALYPYYIRF